MPPRVAASVPVVLDGGAQGVLHLAQDAVYRGFGALEPLLELGQDALTDAQRRLLVANGAAG